MDLYMSLREASQKAVNRNEIVRAVGIPPNWPMPKQTNGNG